MVQVYWLAIDISFSPPLIFADNEEGSTGEKAFGALIEIGVTETSEEDAKKQAISHIREFSDWDNSQYSVAFDHIGVIETNDIQSEIYGDNDICDSLIQNPSQKGIWYRSGFAFYTDENEI